MKFQIKYYRSKLLYNEFNDQFPLFNFKEITAGVSINYSYSYGSPNIIHCLPNCEDFNSVAICIYKLIDPAFSPQKNNSNNCYLNVIIIIDMAYIAKTYCIKTPSFIKIRDSLNNTSVYLHKKWMIISIKWMKNLEYFLFSCKIPDAYIKARVFQYLYEITLEAYSTLYPNIKIDIRNLTF